MEAITREPLAVSFKTAARLLDCGKSTIYAHVAAGHLRAAYVGSDRRIPMLEIQRAANEGLPPIPRRKPEKCISKKSDREGGASVR